MVVDLRGNTAQFQSDMNRAGVILNKNVSSMKQSVGGLAEGFATLTRGLAAFGVSLSVAGVVAFMRQLVTAADATKSLSEQLNISTDALQALDAESKDAGTRTDTLHESIQRLNEAIGEAAGGNHVAEQSFVDLGIAFKTTDGHARDGLSTLVDMATGYANATDKTKFMADASNVLGRRARDLIPIFQALANEGIQAVIDKQKEAGQVASPETLSALDQFGDKAVSVWNQIFVAAQGAVGQYLIFFGLAHRTELQTLDKGISDLTDQWNNLQDALKAGQAPTGALGAMEPLSPEMIQDFNNQMDDIFLKLDELSQKRKDLIAGGKFEPQDIIPGTPYAPGGQKPSVTASDKTKAIKDEQSALTDLLQTMRETLTVNSANIGQQAEIEAAYKASDAAQRDYTAGLRDSPLLTGEELDMLKSLHDEDVARQNVAAAVKAQQHAYEEMDKQSAELAATQAETVRELADGLSQIGAGLVNASAGFRSWKEAAADAIDTVFRMLLNLINTTGFFGLFPTAAGSTVGAPHQLLPRAAGGPVMAGSSYMVGERGPEMFTPSASGVITPNGWSGGGTTVNVINNTGTMARTSERNEGGRRIIDVTIDEAASKSIRTRGGLAQVLESTYGLNRRGM